LRRDCAIWEGTIITGEPGRKMNGPIDIWSGPHHFWTHFGCGLIFGAGVGSWIGWLMFDSGWRMVGTVVVIALGVAYSAGRWGDRFWFALIENLCWLT